MSHASSPSFARRSRRIIRNNRLVARSADVHIGPDGLMTVRPRRRAPSFDALKGILIVLAVLFTMKSIMLASAGNLAYQERVNALRDGSAVERVGAFVMQADPLTRQLASGLGALMR
ncbi:hypothetical protein [Oceaniglobus roseus]|uniref:hypothetical protein n=1 Tax=Oceaniglobus roseus TaxID=1737570 RepID=UPI001562B92F|nr:hypothetical protein [Kandeliimicrobium roseum]